MGRQRNGDEERVKYGLWKKKKKNRTKGQSLKQPVDGGYGGGRGG